jgi:heme/copper-type cytochrome/quinol oxidase subunit 2
MCCDNPPQKRNWRLYHLLDLITPITARQVKWNFRKVTLRHHYYQAYLVLYNRSRKYLFDSIGEDAYGFISSGTWGPFVPAFGTVGTVLLYCIVLMVEMALLLIFFAFLGAQDDGRISWTWEKVVAPLMVFVIIMLVVAILAVFMNLFSPRTYREGMAWTDRMSPIGNLLAAICYFCIPFVIGHKINTDPSEGVGKFLTYMCLPIMGDIFYYLTSLIWRWPRRLRLQMEVGNNRPNPVIYRGIFAMGILNMLCGITQWVLIGYKLDEKLNRSWYIIFIPFCFRMGFRVAEACLRSLMKYTIGVRSQIGVAFDTVGSFFSNGILLISLYFVAVRIERGKEKVKLAHALIPVYITLAYIFIFLLVTMILLLIFYCRRSSEERRINSQWTPPQDNEEDMPKTLEQTTTSDTAPARVLGTQRRGWDDVDHLTDSSAAFPENLDANANEQDYDDFETDGEEPVFQDAEESPRSSQLPYGSPHDEEDREKTYSDATPDRDKDGYEVRRKITTTTRRVYEVPAHEANTDEATTRTASSATHSSSHDADSRRRHTPESASAMTGSSSGEGTDDYTEVTTYLDEATSATHTEEDGAIATGDSSSYTEETTYIDEETSYTGDYDEASGSVTRSGSYSSTMSSSSAASSYTSSAASSPAKAP